MMDKRDPYNEQWLRNEVIYLHSLWHQGPPPPPHPLPPPPTLPHPYFQPSSPPNHARNPKKIKINPSLQISTTPWPCPPTPSPKSTSWPTFPPTHFPSSPKVQSFSPKLQSWATIQLKIVKLVKEFFNSQKNESDDDVEMEDSDSDEDSDDYLGFFLRLFEENGELREFYEKNCEDGEFGCLVCGGVGFIRRFKDCVALVQHTVSISKTKKKNAHRAFGQVVCKVLGWDINKLPSIASSISEKKSAYSSKLEEDHHQVQGKLIDEAGNVGSLGKDTGEKESAGADELPDNVVLAVAEGKLINEDENVESLGKETGEKGSTGTDELPDNAVLAVAEADPDNVSKDVSEKGDAKTEGKDTSSDEKLPITDISNLADQHKESLNGKQENAESTSNCVAGPDNDSKDVDVDIDACYDNEKGDAETEGNDTTMDEKLSITDISNLADQHQETLDGKQEHAEFRIEDGSDNKE